MKYIIVLGCHSEVVYSILTYGVNHVEDEEIKFVSYPSKISIDKFPDLIKNNYGGGLDMLSIQQHNDCEFIIGIGDNQIRKQIVDHYPNLNYINAIHPKTTLLSNIKMGVGNVICPGAVIQTGSELGNHNIINTNTSVDHHCIIRDYCHIAPSCALCGNVKLYDGVFIAVGCSIVPQVKIKAWSFYKANSLIKTSTAPIQMYEPMLDNYKESALDAINSGWISSLGKYVALAGDKFKEITGAKNVILVNNGTSATHCLFLALKYRHPEITKIYVPNNVYVAAWNCALMEYDETQIEVMKINPETWNISTDEDYIKSLSLNSAVLIVHNIGNIINVPRLKSIRPDLIFVEDNCEGLFGKYGDSYTSTTSATLCSSISFFGNKTITSGEGGAVITSDQDLADYLHKTCHQGITKQRYIHDVLGYNYRMTNIQAGFLYDQFCDHENIIEVKKRIFDRYHTLLQPLILSGQIKLQQSEADTSRAHWMFALRIPNNISYDRFNQYMSAQGIDVRPLFYPIGEHEHLKLIKVNESEWPTKLNNECAMLPSSPTLTLKEQEYIVQMLKQYILSL
jgi:perosamine synthetase